MQEQEVHEYETFGGIERRLPCRVISLSPRLQTNLRIILDNTEQQSEPLLFYDRFRKKLYL